jgi:hypothetical protein
LNILKSLFQKGCPNGHVVNNDTDGTAHKILTDKCSEIDGDDWLVRNGTNNTDAEIIIDLGCTKKIKGIQMKNIKKEQGGTKNFTVFLSESSDGPWIPVLTKDFPEQETFGCAPMQTFDLGYVK